MKKIGIILSAGSQSRFNSDIPKALMKITNKSLLELNLNNLNKFCDIVYIVCSHNNKDYFNKFNNVIEIDSGFGCGDAVLKALSMIDINKNDTCFIQWGDSLQSPDTYEQCIKAYTKNVIIPCNIENNPYVQILKNKDSVKVLFSKYKEKTTKGFHDLSLFYGNANDILRALKKFKDKIFINNKYVHKHGNEMQFLDIFNETDIKATILDMGGSISYAFNTIEELNQIKLKINV